MVLDFFGVDPVLSPEPFGAEEQGGGGNRGVAERRQADDQH